MRIRNPKMTKLGQGVLSRAHCPTFYVIPVKEQKDDLKGNKQMLHGDQRLQGRQENHQQRLQKHHQQKLQEHHQQNQSQAGCRIIDSPTRIARHNRQE